MPLSTKRHFESSLARVNDAFTSVTPWSCAISRELPASKNCDSVKLTSARGVSFQFAPAWKSYDMPRWACHSGVNGRRLLSVAVAVGVTGPNGGGGVILSNSDQR